MKEFPNIINKLLTQLQCSDIKGKYRFFIATRKWLNQYCLKYPSIKGNFFVPYSQWCFWMTKGPSNYYSEETIPFCKLINKELEQFDFIDLGADVGVFSHIIAANCPGLRASYSFEPNPKSFMCLEKNSDSAAYPNTVFNQAVSSFDGNAELTFDDSGYSDHEGHININKAGNTKVVTLDSALDNKLLSQNLVIKIDVEGQEQEVIKGAINTITKCERALLLIEIHPDTLKNTGLTAEDIFSEVEKIRPVSWRLPKTNQTVNRNKAFFEQFEKQQYDVIGLIE